MSRHRSGFTSRRRAYLAKKVSQLEVLETKNTITEPISVLGLSLGAMRGLALFGVMPADGWVHASIGAERIRQAPATGHPKPATTAPISSDTFVTTARLGSAPNRAVGGGTAASAKSAAQPTAAHAAKSGDWLTLTPPATSDLTETGISAPWHPIGRMGGGAAMPPRGGSGAPTPTKAATRGAITPVHLPPSTPAASNGGVPQSSPPALGSGPGHKNAPPAAPSNRGAAGTTPGGTTLVPADVIGGSGGSTPPSSIPSNPIGNGSRASQESFTYFPLYVLDVDDGVVLFPGVDQLATLNGNVDLEAQVSGTTVSSYNWNTSGLTDYNHLSATNTYQLTFGWSNAFTDDPGRSRYAVGHRHQQPYRDLYIRLPTRGGFDHTERRLGRPGNATWPTSLDPGRSSDSAPAFEQRNGYASVDATSGALDTEIDLPSYNPNVPALALTYDSLTANPMPISRRREHAQLIGGVSLPGQRPVDLQRHRRHDLVLQHQPVQPRRRPADRAPGHRRHRRSRPAGTATRSRSSTSARPTRRSPTAARPP